VKQWKETSEHRFRSDNNPLPSLRSSLDWQTTFRVPASNLTSSSMPSLAPPAPAAPLDPRVRKSLPSLSLTPTAAYPPRHPEYATFLHPAFEADGFAHAVLNGEPYPPPSEGEEATSVPTGGFMKGLVGEGGTGGVSAALSRLNFGVEDLNRQLKAEVCRFRLLKAGQRSPIARS